MMRIAGDRRPARAPEPTLPAEPLYRYRITVEKWDAGLRGHPYFRRVSETSATIIARDPAEAASKVNTAFGAKELSAKWPHEDEKRWSHDWYIESIEEVETS
jgi:hypothetical protein